ADRLARGISRSGAAIDRHRTQIVVANDRRRSRDELRIGDGTQWNEVAPGSPHAHPEDVLYRFAVRSVGLHLDLPSAAEAIEVVDVGSAHRGLQCAEDVPDRDSQGFGAFAIEIQIDLRG